MCATMTLRSASAEDADLLLQWANGVAVRAASLSRRPIGSDEHRAWLDRLLADPDHRRLWIGLLDGRPIGQVRVETGPPGTGVVSIAVAPEARGQGLGGPLLAAALAAAPGALAVRRLRALVRAGNAASRRLFEAAGFEAAAEERAPDGEAVVVYERAAPAGGDLRGAREAAR